MKQLLLDILNNDHSYNKCATRYLYKTHPDLWAQILERTSFLPDTALAKQRVWHIINNTWQIPICPITGRQVKWWENRYLKTSDYSAKMKWQHSRGDFKNQYTDQKYLNKVKQGNLDAVKKGRKYRSKDTYTQQQKQKNIQTCLERYSVPNGGQSQQARQKVAESRIRNGATPRHLRSLRRLYYDAVWRFTEQSWREQFDKINPTRRDRSQNALDHIYSIQQGFRDSIPPYVIGHWTNLRIITLRENSTKGMRCDKTVDQLFEEFELNTR
jgi:hypothetical protein